MKRKVKAGVTSYTVTVFIPDTSSSTGAGLTGLTNASSGLTCYYRREGGSASVSVSLASGTLGTWSSGGFKELDATNMKGQYELGIPDAALASGAKYVTLALRGATNMPEVPIEIELDALDYQDAVRFGMTALPNAAAEAAGGLYTRGSGAGQIRQDANGRIDANAKAWIDGAIPAVNITGVPKVDLVDWLGSAPDALSSGKVPADLKLWLASAPAALSTNGYVQTMLLRWLTDNAGGTPNALISNRVDANAQVVGDKTGYSLSQSFPTNFSSLSIDSGGVVKSNLSQILGTALTETAGQIAAAFKKFFNVGVPVLDTTSVNQTGDNYSRLGAPAGASIAADLAEIEAETDAIGTDTSGVTTLLARIPGTVQPQTGDSYARLGAPVGASISADIAEVEAETDNIGSDTPGVTTLLGRIPGTVQPQTGDAYARLGAPVGASISADIAEVEADVDALGSPLQSGNVTVGGYAAGEDPATLLLATPANKLATDSSGNVTVGTIVAAAIQSIWDRLTSALTTVGSIGKLLADNINATISSRSTYAGGDTSGTTTLLGRLTSGRAANLDNLDAAVSTRSTLGGVAQTGDSYVRLGAPAGASVSADIAEIEAETDGIGGDTPGVTTLLARIPGIVQPQTGDSYSRLGAPAGASVSADIAEVESDVDALGSPLQSGNVTVGGYAAGQDPATLVLDVSAVGHNTAGTIGADINAAAAGGGGGTIYGSAGAILYTFVVYQPDGTTPAEGASVYVSSDITGFHRSEIKVTDSLGRVQYHLDAGTVFFWTSHPDFNFTNPTTEVVS